MTTIKDVARLAGVSPSTVSKYINGGSVRKENIASIRSAIARLDYRVNPIARSLKTRRSHSVGILLPSLAAPFFSSVFMASDRVLRERGYHSMISCYYAVSRPRFRRGLADQRLSAHPVEHGWIFLS